MRARAGGPSRLGMGTTGKLNLPPAWRVAIEAWDTYLRAAHQPETTRGLRTYHLRRLADHHHDRDPFEITFDDLVHWLALHDWAAETRRSNRSSLRLFYAWAHATGRMPTNPAHGLPPVALPRRLPRPAPDDVVLAALARADVRVRLMVLVAAHAGLRRGEVARLHTDDLERDLCGWSLRVHGKGARERLVPLDDDLGRALEQLPPGYAFPGRVDGHLSPARVGELVSEVLGPGWTAHTLRHRFATLAYSVERDLRAVQELLGHSKPETTATYTQIPEDARRRAAAGARLEVTRPVRRHQAA